MTSNLHLRLPLDRFRGNTTLMGGQKPGWNSSQKALAQDAGSSIWGAIQPNPSCNIGINQSGNPPLPTTCRMSYLFFQYAVRHPF